VTANDQPASNARLIIAAEVVGVALARPKGFSNFKPAISTLISTLSIGVKNLGRHGCLGTKSP
jgi:hypothetical protein